MSDAAISFAVLGAVVVLFVSNRVPVEIVAVGSALALFATGVLDADQVFAGFGDPTIAFIATLFVVSEALDATGVTAWAGQQLIAATRGDRTRLTVFTMLLAAALTALISVNGAVAALLPMVVVLATRLDQPSSQLLMPMAFAAHSGSLLALTGTPVNVLVSEAAEDATGHRFGFFEFALVGLPLLAGTVAVVVLIGGRVLPHRRAQVLPPDLSGHAHTLVEQYAVHDLALHSEAVGGLDSSLITREHGVAEVVIPPRSPAVGLRAFPGMTTSGGDLVVLAIQRQGQDLQPGECTLAVGDTLLLQGTWDALDREITHDPDVLVVDAPQLIKRQAVPMGPRSRAALAVVGAMVVLLASGAVPPAVAGLLAAGALVLVGVVTVDQAYRSISWTTVVLVGGLIPLSNAMRQSGAAEDVADLVVRVVGDAGPYAVAAGLFLVTAILGQLISNIATALIVIPIAVSVAAETSVSTQPLLMTVNIAAAAALLTPVATPANMMVMGPGNYRFGDYWKLGLPIMGLYLVVAVFLVPVVWPF